jgi:elongator complex protein 1
MALHEIEAQSNIIDVAFNADASLLAVLHQQGLSIYEWKSLAASGSAPQLTGRVTFSKTDSIQGVSQQITFGDKDEILVLQRLDSESLVKRYEFNDDTGRMEEVTFSIVPEQNLSILSSFSRDGKIQPFAQDTSGGLHNLAPEEQSISHCKFPMFLPWVELVPFGEDVLAFGMSSNGHLYANSRLLVKNCTSFLVTPAHLIFTTTTHLLKFVHVTTVSGM